MDTTEIEKLPEYQATMQKLEAVKRKTAGGKDYWRAREIHEILGYPTWAPKIERSWRGLQPRACAGASMAVEHRFAATSIMMEVGEGTQQQGSDYFLSRGACYLVAMNGEPYKPEIAATRESIFHNPNPANGKSR